MRALFLLPVFAVAAVPATAQPAVPPELTSPETSRKLSNAMQALSRALMDLKVGEVEAALEGRAVTDADKRRTIRETGRAGDPNFEANLQQQLAAAQPAIDASMKALAAALPAMMKSMESASQALDRATANLPSPNYPKR